MISTIKNTKNSSHGRIHQGKYPHTIGEITWAIGSRRLVPFSSGPAEYSRFQRAYVDFFEDQLVLNGYDWRKVLGEYLFTGKAPLINCMIAGRMSFCIVRGVLPCSNAHNFTVGHPLIHLGYAFELSSRELAMEALGLATTSYDFLHKYLDDSSYTKPSTYDTSSPIEILGKVVEDKRFDNLFDHQGADNIAPLFKDHEAAVLEHWNAWQLPNPKKQFEDSQYAAVALLVATHECGGSRSYDFFLVHLLTTSHAVRILLPLMPAKFHVALVRQWWLLTLAVYISQTRPKVELNNITSYDIEAKNWAWVDKQAVEGKWSLDAHFVKALRAMKEAAQTWGDGEQYYLKAACRLGVEFDGWGGFGPSEAGGRRGSATGH